MAGSGGLIGKTISHYRILEKLGGGGMGVVYKAEDTQLGRFVALKFLSEPLVGDIAALQRFQREARMASALDHPNICTIYEIGAHAGLPFIAMQYLEGQTLEQRIAGKPLPIDLVVSMGIQIADALEAAHSMGIIHRDIKPSNIYVTKRDQPRILDFGVAKLTRDLRTGVSEVPGRPPTTVDALSTVPGAQIGTFAYMSPEQERGEELDARTDLFSFGLMLYDMATGWHSFSDKVAAVIHDAVGSQEPVVRSATALPAGLGHVISKATQVDRDHRYQSAAEMRAELEQLKELKKPERTTVGGGVPRTKREGQIGKIGKAGIVAGFVAITAGAAAFLYLHRAPVLTEKDAIVLADFDNRTGDPVFDDTLKQALAVDLGQSPFLNILSDRKVAATLRLMNRAPDQPATGEIARELCQRMGSKALLGGSIAKLGNNYVIGLTAINCTTGDVLVEQQVEARSKEDVLKELGKAVTVMRGKLGESLASVQKSTTPIQEATTSSLDALKAYSTGRRVADQKGSGADLPYLQRAVQLDPNFALAYRGLALSYLNLGQATRAQENAQKAFDLRQRVSERERYGIESLYYKLVTGDLEKADQVYELWEQNYPRDYLPFGNLGDNYMQLGQWEKALQETLDSINLEPTVSIFTGNLAEVLLALNRTEEAKTSVERARARGMDSYTLRLDLYEAAFLLGDQETMQQQLAWAAGQSGVEDWLLSAQSNTEAYFGHLTKAREFSQRAVESARRADAQETAALWHADAALYEAEFGNASAARQEALAALALVAGRDVTNLAALALARAGDAARGRKLADRLNKKFPGNTIVQGYWLPSIRAATEIDEKHAVKAIDILRAAAPYELGQAGPFQFGMLYPMYLRGQAYLLVRHGKEAAAEFQKIVDYRGIVLNFPLGALARLGLARAYAVQGDTAKTRAAYDEFFTLWKDADPEIPILKQAKSEYAKLRQ